VEAGEIHVNARPAPTRVVIVDDAEELRILLRLALDREEDFSVVAEAADGETGVAAVIAHQPDLVLLDIAMPVLDGLQALPLIRDECPGATVVMLSGFGATSHAAIEALRLGAHAYIQKEGALMRLANQLRDLMGTRAPAPRASSPRRPRDSGRPQGRLPL